MDIDHEPQFIPPTTGEEKKKDIGNMRFIAIFRYLALLVIIIAGPFFVFFSLPPRDFPAGEIVVIETGMTFGEVAQLMEERRVVRSSQLMQIIALVRDRNFTVSAGSYLMDEPMTVFEVLRRLHRGLYGDVYERITIPEGSSNIQIAALLEDADLADFDPDVFFSLAKEKEGYLFPDTYFFFPDISEEGIISQMENNFEAQTADLAEEVAESEKTFEEIIIMASIIEKEANKLDEETGEASIISGILWRRIRIGMPLQVDAPFLYLLGKASHELTRSDLAIDSPFNTYRYTGLVPAPIGNPGRNAIIAALSPVETEYLYYLHDKGGVIHYAETFAGHTANINTYLR